MGKLVIATHKELTEMVTSLRAENEKLREERQELKNELAKWVHYWRDKDVKALSAENEKLRAALMGIIADMNGTQFPQTNVRAISVGALNAAAAALKETGDE